MSLRIHDDEGHPGDWVPFVASWRISLTSPRVCAMTETRRELTRPDLAEKWRGEADNQRVTHTLGAVAQAQTLRRCADELDAQPAPLTPTPQPDGRWVEAIWHILVTEGGANAEDRDAFIAQWPDCVEYRFGGHLGSGGKVWAPGSKRSVPVVDFYPESSTVSRRAIAARINVHLCDAYVMAIALGSAAPPPTPVERPAAITDEMLRAAETHHGDSCSYCTSTGDIDCPTAAVLDALAAATSQTDRHAVRHFRRGDRLCPQCGDPIDGHVHKDEPDPLTAFLAWWDDALVNSPSLSINEMKWRIDTLRGTDA